MIVIPIFLEGLLLNSQKISWNKLLVLWSALSECCMYYLFTGGPYNNQTLIPNFISASWKLFFEPYGICCFGSISLRVTFSGPMEKYFSFFLISSHNFIKVQKVFPRQNGMLIMKLGYSKAKLWKVNLNFEVLCDPKKMWTCESAQFCPVLVQFFSSELIFSLCRILDEVNQIQTYLQIAGNCFEKILHSEIPSFKTLWR